jgi:hypothetical protein
MSGSQHQQDTPGEARSVLTTLQDAERINNLPWPAEGKDYGEDWLHTVDGIVRVRLTKENEE